MSKPRIRAVIVASALLTGLVAPIATNASALAVPPEFEDVTIASVSNPMDIAFTPDGRMLIPDKLGRLWVIENEAVLPTPAIDLSVMASHLAASIPSGV